MPIYISHCVDIAWCRVAFEDSRCFFLVASPPRRLINSLEASLSLALCNYPHTAGRYTHVHEVVVYQCNCDAKTVRPF